MIIWIKKGQTPNRLTPRYILKNTENICPHRNLYMNIIFLALSFTIAPKFKQPKCSSTDEWINKMGYILTMNII